MITSLHSFDVYHVPSKGAYLIVLVLFYDGKGRIVKSLHSNISCTRHCLRRRPTELLVYHEGCVNWPLYILSRSNACE